MHNTYRLAIVYFTLFSILLLVSAFMLFFTKIGFSIEDINTYYIGNEAKFMHAKTLSGTLKVLYPHMFSIALFSMVILHFVYFTKFNNSLYFRYLIILTYLSIFLEIFSGFFMILGISMFAFVKLASFISMFIVFLFLFWLILHSILSQKK